MGDNINWAQFADRHHLGEGIDYDLGYGSMDRIFQKTTQGRSNSGASYNPQYRAEVIVIKMTGATA